MFDLRAMLAAKADEQLQAIAASYQTSIDGLDRADAIDTLVSMISQRLKQFTEESLAPKPKK